MNERLISIAISLVIAGVSMRTTLFWTALLWTCILSVSSASAAAPVESKQPAPIPSPVSPERSLELFQLAPGLRIELVASEPQVIDPVAIRFDEHGRMWVVEMRDYPHGPAPGQPPRSRIRVLEDRDGDGRMDHSRVFADGLLFVTGVQPWQGGAIVTLSGRVAYLKDTTGDGRADKTETWYTGFAEENSQLRANHPRFALDNHIYIANGLRGGAVVDARKPGGKPLPIRGMDFRFEPRSGSFASVTGNGQFGMALDDFGNRFLCSNRNPLRHVVFEDRYLKRNPRVAVAATIHDVARFGEDSRIFPISRAWTTSTLHAGQFTAACGVHVFRGDGLPPAMHGNGFTCDPTGNLVHREVLTAAGPTFDSKPAREGVEFLASPDEWFRPVNLVLGPDGALYVVDMHRAVIEHPQFMPTELKRRPDLLKGIDRGRIYRIVAADRKPPRLELPGDRPGSKLVKLLAHPNAWQRETAARLIYERQDREIAGELEKLALHGKHAAARVHALWALQGLGLLSEKVVLRAAVDEQDARVRRQAIVLAERWLATSPSARSAMLKLADDPDAGVRFQLALGLIGKPLGDDGIDALVEIAAAGADDEWTRRAVALAVGDQASALTRKLLASPVWLNQSATAGEIAMTAELAALVGRNGSDPQRLALVQALANLPDQDAARRIQRAGFLGLAKAAASQKAALAGLIDRLTEPRSKQRAKAALVLARETASRTSETPDVRREAIELLAYDPGGAPQLAQLAADHTNRDIRLAAIAALSRHAAIEPWDELLAEFPAESPVVRNAILDGLLARTDRTKRLLDEISAGRIKPGEIDRLRAARLLKHRDAAIKSAAAKLLASAVPADRKQVLAEYQSCLKLKGDPRSGQAVFKKICAACHRVGGLGVNVAPDIADTRTKQPAQILTDILQPNRAIDAGYVNYAVITSDGRSLAGIIAAETATSITLRQPENKTILLLRDDIDEIRSTGISLMPEGLEKDIPPQAMADLIAFLKNWRYLDGRTPLGDSAAGR